MVLILEAYMWHLPICVDSQGNCQLALRWGWMASDIVDLDALTCPRVEPRYPRQIFWQKDLCEDGARHVGDAGGWTEIQPCGDIAAVCMVLHQSQLTAASEQACMHPPPKPGQESRDPDHPEVFFYSMQYDSSVKRWEDCWLDEHAHLRQPPQRWKGLLPFLDVCCGMGAVSRAAQDLTNAARAGQADSTDALQGFQVLGGVEKETDPCNAYLGNIMSAADPLTINRAVSLHDFNAGVLSQKEIGRAPEWVRPGCRAPQAGEVGCLHASPPCQGVTPLNTKRNTASLSSPSGLFPLLAEIMRTVDLLRPVFFTLEEVPSFLAASVKAQEGGSETARCIWAVVFPLLDMGYQVDRVILFAAKTGYKLCCPPKPWNHYSADSSRRGPYLGEDAVLINCADNSWRHISLSSEGLADEIPGAVSAKEAIHDLPADVTPGSQVKVMAYAESSPGRTSAFAKCMRSGQARILFAQQIICLTSSETCNHLGKPGAALGGLDAGTAQAALCPRPEAQRLLTLAERARLQGLPDSLQPYGSTEAKLAKQIGNAVPYPMAWAILGSIFEAAYGCAAPIPSYVTADRAGRSSCPATLLETLCEDSCKVPPTVIEQLHGEVPMNPEGQSWPARRWAHGQKAARSFSADAHCSFPEAAHGSAKSKGGEDELLCQVKKNSIAVCS
ncbi:probable DNA (cytosine-5)-methyltransferase 2 [Coccomyxa sp. Obi]|nr:probable DNA (cytosine-5)-methyltransferase 2 [Coccomyxa sp. Obi]